MKQLIEAIVWEARFELFVMQRYRLGGPWMDRRSFFRWFERELDRIAERTVQKRFDNLLKGMFPSG